MFIEPYLNNLKRYQLVILRNYGFVSDDKICKILKISNKKLLEEVKLLGLKAKKHLDFVNKSYITIIRNNWDLLSIEQIAFLLDVSIEKLNSILKEEDFLNVKLGRKPLTTEIKMEKLNDNDLKFLENVREITALCKDKKDYFNFNYYDGNVTRVNNCIAAHPYIFNCSGDLNPNILSDEILEAYKKCGINCLWFTALLSRLSPYPFSRSKNDYQFARTQLQKLIDKCKKHGIDVILYFNEPRFLDNELAKLNSKLIGHKQNNENAICLSKEENQNYLYNAFLDLFKSIDGLKGVMIITMSENLTHCHSKGNGTCTCQLCKDKKPEELAALVNNLIAKASKDSKKNIEIIANIWGWSKFMGWADKNTLHGISLLDKSISVLAVSEYDLKIKHAKKKLSLVDYSISNIGPSEVSKKMLSFARKLGHKVYAKIQVNNSWECSAVPFYPNYFSLAQHIKNLFAIGVNDFFCSWTLGGYPSLNFVLVNELIKNPKLNINNLLEKNFGKKLSLGIKKFDSALKYYPFSVDNLYFGPKTLGLTNLWKIHDSEESSMVCFSRNDYKKWIHPFNEKDYLADYEKMFLKFEQGFKILEFLNSNQNAVLKDYAEVAYLNFQEDYLKTKYCIALKNNDFTEIKKLAEVEYENVLRFFNLFVKHPEIGFEASNHYYYTERNFIEKLINIKYNFIN